jgi:membrane-associated protein
VPVGGFLDPGHLIGTFGLIGIMLILFAECGLLIGFFLPGDSLLFTAGLVAAGGAASLGQGLSKDSLPPLWVLLVCFSAAAVFNKPDSRLFKAEYVERSHAFFERNGNKTIVLARFVPVVRTFATVMAGASRMNVRSYAVFSLIGGVAWAAGITLLGYWLGGVQVVRDHIELFVLGVVVVSLLPIVVEYLRGRSRARA